MSGYLRDSQLRKQLEEKVKEATRTRQAAEEGLKAAQDLIDQARRTDANVVEAEKALAEANAAMASKDYKVAVDKAGEALERGKRIYRERARGIVDSSAALGRLAKGVGGDLAETEAALAKAEGSLASEDLGTAIDLAKKAWKRSEKILQEHLSSSFSKAQSLILAAKNLSRDVAPVEDLLSRARTAMENNDFQSALDFTNEALETITDDLTSAVDKEVRDVEDLVRTAAELGADTTKATTLIERARGDIGNLDFEKAKNAIRQSRAESEKALQRSLDGRAGDFSKFVQEARALGADPAAGQESFDKADAAIKKGHYREGAQLAKQGFQALQQAQFQRVVGVIATSREKFTAAANMGIDIRGPMADLTSARDLLKRGAFRDALDSAKRADGAVDTIIQGYRTVEGRLKEMHRAFAETEAFGVQTVRARKLAEVARQAYQERNLADVAKAVDAAAEELRKAERERVMQSIERAEFVLTLGEQAGADLADASKLLHEAIVATKADEHRRALQLAGDAQAKAERILSDRAGEKIVALRAALPHLGDDAGSLKAMLNRADASIASRDFEETFRALAEGEKFVEIQIHTHAEEIVGDLALAVRIGVDVGANVAPLEAIHRNLNGFLARGQAGDIVAAREKARATLASVSEELAAFVRARITTAEGLKIDVDEMSDLVRRSRLAFGVQNYHEGLRLLNEANERASKMTALHRQAYNAIASGAAFVAEAKKRNVDVSKVVEMLVDAKKAFERLEYEQALQMASSARAETDKLTVLYSSAQRILSSRGRLELAGKMGIDAPHLRDVFGAAKEAMKAKEYEKALTLAQRAEDEFTSLIKEKLTSSLAAAESVLGSVEGVNLAQSSDAIVRARQHLDAGELEQAADLTLRLREQLDILKRQGDEAATALRRLREIVTDAEAMSLPLAMTTGLLERADRAYKMGQFEEALDHAAQAEAEASKERDRGIASRMKGFEESLLRARMDGTDTRSAERLFERAREFFRAKKYRQAIAAAEQSEEEAERVGLQQGMSKQAVESVERKLRAIGKGPLAVTSLVSDSRRMYNDGDYVKALDTAIRASDAIADLRILLEEVQDVRNRAQGLLQTAYEVGADSTKFEKFFQEGEVAYEAGEVERAQSAFAGSIDWGLGLLKSHVREELAKGEALVETCRKMEIDPTPVQNKFSEARTLADAENFREALARIQSGRDAAQSALAGKLNRALQEAADNVAHAKKFGSDSRDAEALLRQANEQILQGEFAEAMDVVNNALERVESAKVIEKRFIDLTFKAETTIRNGRKFGIDMKVAEGKLAQAMQLRKADLPEAIKAAEEAYRVAWEATEEFAPSMKAYVDVGPVRLNEWADATLTVENVGKGLAKDVRVRILGDAETDGMVEIPGVGAHRSEALRLRLKMTASGSVPLAIQIVSHRVFDNKEYTQEMIAQVDVSERVQEKAKRLTADLESRCPICKGLIKTGFKVTRCGCGRDFHELCASRVGRCPVCFRSLQGAVE
ncbi:MAG: hypothetical protein E6K03_01100 [Methanobacteriota archaeon]|nr:MAG: hypothetical protein E6K03_01100 [Euryarchaeota archaeon]